MLFSSIMVVDATTVSNIEKNRIVINNVNGISSDYFKIYNDLGNYLYCIRDSFFTLDIVIEGEFGGDTYVDENIVIFYACLLVIVIIILLFTRVPLFGKNGSKVRSDVSFYREFPVNNDIFRSYWIANKCGLIEKREDFLVTILLKWIYEGNIKIKCNNNIWCINLLKKPVNGSKIEKKLYSYLVSASINGKLSEFDFENWCKRNYKKILNWFDDVIYFETMKLLKNKEISYKQDSNMMAFSYNYFDVSSSIDEDAEKLAGLKKFLEEFTMISEREPLEVNLWEDYLIYAQMFGIADKVSKRFNEFYPEVVEKMLYFGDLYEEVFFVNSMIFSGVDVARSVNAVSTKSDYIEKKSTRGINSDNDIESDKSFK